jgi:hypothetical protein
MVVLSRGPERNHPIRDALNLSTCSDSFYAGVMAKPDTSTAVDHATEALMQIDAARRELHHWETHLRRMIAGGNYGIALQADNSALIVQSVINRGVNATHAACNRMAPTSEGGNPTQAWLLVAEHGRHFHPGAGLESGGLMCHDHDNFGYHCHDKHHYDTAAYDPNTEQ